MVILNYKELLRQLKKIFLQGNVDKIILYYRLVWITTRVIHNVINIFKQLVTFFIPILQT